MAETKPQDEMQRTRETASEEMRRASGAARDEMDGARDRVARSVSDATEMAQAEADRRLRAAAGRGADHVERSADAASAAASDYEEGSLPHEALGRVSGFLEDTARGLRDADLEQVTGEVRRFARRNPLAFVAGAAVVGFAAARLLRASDRDEVGDNEFGPSAGQAPGWQDTGWQSTGSRDASEPPPRGRPLSRDREAPQVAPVGPAVGGRHA